MERELELEPAERGERCSEAREMTTLHSSSLQPSWQLSALVSAQVCAAYLLPPYIGGRSHNENRERNLGASRSARSPGTARDGAERSLQTILVALKGPKSLLQK
mmetsp:Transcript_55305/g.131926  ORF Transcript_55305/g.131926 Transcript_55305/m.131926 type:complete len:104 (+) Transcript_55305:275-586(+)